MPDLTSLMQVAPGFATFQLGAQSEQERVRKMMEARKSLEDIMTSQQGRDIASKKLPLELEGLQTQNDERRATTKNLGLTGVGLEQSNAFTAATQPGKIAATNSGNQETVLKNQYEQGVRAQEALIKAAPLLQNTPAPFRAQAFRQHLVDHGMNPDAQQFQAVMRANPNDMPKIVGKMSDAVADQLLKMSPTARATMYSADQHRIATENSAKEHSAAVRYSADRAYDRAVETAALRKKADDLITNIKSGRVPPERVKMAAKMELEMTEDETVKQHMREVIRFADETIRRTAEARQPGGQVLGERPDGSGTGLVNPPRTPLQIDPPKPLSNEELLKHYLNQVPK